MHFYYMWLKRAGPSVLYLHYMWEIDLLCNASASLVQRSESQSNDVLTKILYYTKKT